MQYKIKQKNVIHNQEIEKITVNGNSHTDDTYFVISIQIL